MCGAAIAVPLTVVAGALRADASALSLALDAPPPEQATMTNALVTSETTIRVERMRSSMRADFRAARREMNRRAQRAPVPAHHASGPRGEARRFLVAGPNSLDPGGGGEQPLTRM
jgi:hypothetical protein